MALLQSKQERSQQSSQQQGEKIAKDLRHLKQIGNMSSGKTGILPESACAVLHACQDLCDGSMASQCQARPCTCHHWEAKLPTPENLIVAMSLTHELPTGADNDAAVSVVDDTHKEFCKTFLSKAALPSDNYTSESTCSQTATWSYTSCWPKPFLNRCSRGLFGALTCMSATTSRSMPPSRDALSLGCQLPPDVVQTRCCNSWHLAALQTPPTLVHVAWSGIAAQQKSNEVISV